MNAVKWATRDGQVVLVALCVCVCEGWWSGGAPSVTPHRVNRAKVQSHKLTIMMMMMAMGV